jgi:methylated-DNA-protein-cysteine methyltransferase related protein
MRPFQGATQGRRGFFIKLELSNLNGKNFVGCIIFEHRVKRGIAMTDQDGARRTPIYARIYAIVRQIPEGKVATYGQIAGAAGGCTARMVGYAMAALPKGSDVPWQRVINRQGKISPHGAGFGSAIQRQLLEDEGIQFDRQGRVDFEAAGWLGQPGKEN